MQNFEHKKLVEAIEHLGKVPTEPAEYSKWIEAGRHLSFLRSNANTEEIVAFASGQYTFVRSLIVAESKLAPVDQSDLLAWIFSGGSSIASYVSQGERVWVERKLSSTSTKTLEGARELLFDRTFDGWTGAGRNHIELNQEYSHLTEIHWRPEYGAYCRFDRRGDLEHVVTVTLDRSKAGGASVVSFRWQPLEEYLAVTGTVLVRLFDFTLFRPNEFEGWSNKPGKVISETPQLFYRQKIDAGVGYTRGVQIVRPRAPATTIVRRMTDRWFGTSKRQYVEFVAYDFRNKQVTKISTDPEATVNYFNAEGNSLPFELSPAFFKPEVLSKYKTDRDKYTLGERDLSCRSAWHLRGLDVNEAGQVHAYICDLRGLPYEEQLHWLSYNEPPQTGISKRAVVNDFQGEFTDIAEPLEEVLRVVRQWDSDHVPWWTLRDPKLLVRAMTPLTASRDDWAEAFMDLAKLVVEGFEAKRLRAALDDIQVRYEATDGTIALLEKLLSGSTNNGAATRLTGLRSVQDLRSKAKGHASGSAADALAQAAISEFGSFSEHFRSVCRAVLSELKKVEALF